MNNVPDHTKTPTVWVITDGKAGMESQCIGLAEAMGLQPVVKRVRLRRLWRELSPYLIWGKRMAISRKGDALQAPWPDMVIASGRLSVVPALHVKKASGGKTFLVQIQNPVLPAHLFDAVVVPEHDKMEGPNVITTLGALHRVEKSMLATQAEKWAARFAHLPRPYVAVLLGGSNSNYRLEPRDIMDLAPKLAALAKREKASLLITPSRRTGEANMVLLAALLHDCPAYIWNGQGDNPYYGMLGAADSFIVTCDSINMISESCSTGKPVQVIRLQGHSDKFTSFFTKLLDQGCMRFFDGALQQWGVNKLDEMGRVAALIRQKYQQKND